MSSSILNSREFGSCKSKPFDEADYYPKVEENVDRKLARFFDFGRRLKGQIQQMHKRELDDLAELHSDPKDKAVKRRGEPFVITGINFRAVNEIYDTRKRNVKSQQNVLRKNKDSNTGANDSNKDTQDKANNGQEQEDEAAMPWMNQTRVKKMSKR